MAAPPAEPSGRAVGAPARSGRAVGAPASSGRAVAARGEVVQGPPLAHQPWNLDRGRRAGEMGYLPGLDGIRAVAVLGVLLYHADLTWIRGGFLGVDVFFVLSGFLITTLILEELDRSGRVDFKQFYLRRARRLLPALLLVLLATAVVAAFWVRDAAPQVRKDGLAALLYSTNWWYVVSDQSYFEFIGRPPMLKHLWSLAVEEQFYLIWPVVVFALYRWRGRRAVRVVALVVALASTVWMISLSVRNGFPELADPSRAYFGTDSHCMGLLVGAALATAWRPGRLNADLPAGARRVVTATGIVALGIVLWFFLRVGEYATWMYQAGGFLLLAVVVAVLIAATTHPGSPFGSWLGTQPWRYVGERSYGLYLWHWPIFMITRPGLDVPVEGVWNLLLRLGLTFGVAELSYRYVEMPIRKGAIGRWWHAWRDADPAERQRRTRGVLVGGGVAAASLVLVGAGLASAPEATANDGLPSDVAAAIGVENGGPESVSIDDEDPTPTPTSGSTGSATATAAPSARPSGSTTAKPAAPVTPRNKNGTMTAIGDSVLLGARVTLKNTIKGTKVDAAVGRQAGAVLDRIRTLKKQGKLAPIVMIHSGTNGIITEGQLRGMLDLLKDRTRVVIVNVNVPRRWMDPNNEVIASVVPDYPNAVIADWNAVSGGHDEFFVSDGVHLTGAGMHAYATLVRKAAGLG